MIPESSENRTVDLYKCVEFPFRWEWMETLLENVAAVDTTVLFHGGKWWLFTSVAENDGASLCEELFIFHLEVLVGGRWQAHDSNPVVSDVRRARPAGATFRDGARLLRPAQDCSVRYGYAMTLNEITSLSENEYAEIETCTIRPPAGGPFIANHTYAYAPGLTVLDGLQPKLRLNTRGCAA